jgi:hypothetical protein
VSKLVDERADVLAFLDATIGRSAEVRGRLG